MLGYFLGFLHCVSRLIVNIVSVRYIRKLTRNSSFYNLKQFLFVFEDVLVSLIVVFKFFIYIYTVFTARQD